MKYEVPDKKKDSYTAILRFMTIGDINLSPQDDIILSRWCYADVLMRKKLHDEDYIINEISSKFEVSIYTARNDIYNSQRLFAKTRVIQKKYLIVQHLERIDEDIQALRKAMFQPYVDDEGKTWPANPDAKEVMALAKMHEAYTYTLNSTPDEIEKTILPPPIFQFMLPPGTTIEKPMTKSEALKAADEFLTLKDGLYQSNEDK